MHILITNTVLNGRSGTELYVRDLAYALLRRGHHPIVYTPRGGALAAELRAATVPVVDDLQNIGVTPDIIHGHHAHETVTALLHFPRTPGVFLCHDWLAWHDTPPRLSRLRRYVAVDETCRDRLVSESGIAPERVHVVPNFVDMQRFVARSALPTRPSRALIFSNYARADTQIAAVQAACVRLDLHLDIVGLGVGKMSDAPEHLLGSYDLVFAKAKSALEAMAVGAAVVLCDSGGLGGMVTPDNVGALRRANFGRRALSRPLDTDAIVGEIQRYDAAAARQVRDFVRQHCSLDATVATLERLYTEVVQEQRVAAAVEPAQEQHELAMFLQTHPIRALEEAYHQTNLELAFYKAREAQRLDIALHRGARSAPAALRLSMDQAIDGLGWYEPEGPADAAWRWTGPERASMLRLEVDTSRPLRLRFWVAMEIRPCLVDSLQVTVNGRPLALRREANPSGGGYLCEAQVPAWGGPAGPLQLVFVLEDTVQPVALGLSGDVRRLGIALKWLELGPWDGAAVSANV